MSTNTKSEFDAPFLKSAPLGFGALHYFIQKKFTPLSKMSFNIEYSCHTIITIKHE